MAWLGFAAAVGISLALNVWSLSSNGWGNTYYAAAVRSMSQSWSNFFFGAFDPGGFITVDKPPLFLWIGSLSVRVFGYSSWSILLPSAIAGAATVALVWLIVRRYFGALAATIAGLVLALTPITVAVDRLNLPEPFFILALVGAAGAVLRSLESRRWWAWIAGAGFLVGVAFNTKMLAGWIPGPAFALALVAGVASFSLKEVRPLLARLALLAAVTFAVSASWMLVVDAVPASDRPYIGGSTDNTVSNLVLDYNGLGRVDGDNRPGGGPGPNGRAPANGNGGAFNRPNGFNGTGGFPNGNSATPNNRNGFGRPGNFGVPGGATGGNVPNGTNGNGNFTAPGGRNGNFTGPGGANGGNPPANAAGPGGANGAGGIIAGTPGWLRMFDAANGGQIAWFLPFALLGGVLCAWYWRRDRVKRAAAVLALGWVVLFAGVFSYAQGIYHSYYTSAIAPGIAILVGMTAIAIIELVRKDWRWLAALGAIVGVTLWAQLTVAGREPNFQANAPTIGIAVLAIGAVVLAVTTVRRMSPAVGVAIVVAGLLITPASWAFYETANASLNTTLPQAGPRQGAAGRSFGSPAFDGGTASLAAFLDAHSDPAAKWDLVVASAQNASTLIADYGLSVMPIGGFSGNDPTITAAQFADMVAAGDVRYVLVGGGQGGGFRGGAPQFGGQSANRFGGNVTPTGGAASATTTTAAKGANAVFAAVESACTPVTGSDVPSQYAGVLYDCANAADALRAAN